MGARSSQSRGPGFNKTDGHLIEYFRQNFGGGGAGTPPPETLPAGIIASGGAISDYEVSGTYYRTHIFNTTGTFQVTQLSSSPAPNNIEYLVVAGGGGSSKHRSGGAGAGGLRTNYPGVQKLDATPLTAAAMTAAVQSYPVEVGAGGAGGSVSYTGSNGGDSTFGPVTSNGGAGTKGAATAGGSSNPVGDGGSGGGNDWSNYGTFGAGNTPPTTPPQGNPGGQSYAPNSAGGQGGGGGAGAPGSDGLETTGGAGGIGVQVLISGPPASPQPMGTSGPVSGGGYFAGGGGGGADNTMTGGAGGSGGGGDATTPGYENNGESSTGGGGGGTVYNPAYGANSRGGNGGSGTVIVRYQITSSQSDSGPLGGAKATGGTFYTYGSKTVHVFTSSGDFTNISGAPLTVDHVLVAGGGGGGSGGGTGAGGGGAGGVRTSIPGLMPVADTQKTVGPGAPNKYTVTVGAGGAGSPAYNVSSIKGSDSEFNGPDGNVNVDGGGRGGFYPGGSPANTNANGGPGGSGGGACGYGTLSPSTLSGGAASESQNQGFAGGNTPGGGPGAGAGGGGAGGPASNSDGTTASHGGVGVQLPTPIRNPEYLVGTPGPSGTHWFAGGGGGGGGQSQTTFGRGGGSGGPYAGGGNGGTRTGSPAANLGGTWPGAVNTGGGGGGANNTKGGDGGSGFVLIIYDS